MSQFQSSSGNVKNVPSTATVVVRPLVTSCPLVISCEVNKFYGFPWTHRCISKKAATGKTGWTDGKAKAKCQADSVFLQIRLLLLFFIVFTVFMLNPNYILTTTLCCRLCMQFFFVLVAAPTVTMEFERTCSNTKKAILFYSRRMMSQFGWL